MRRHLAALALLSALASPVPASASAIIEFPDEPTAVPGNNDFATELANMGLYTYVTAGASITLDAAATITFYFLGSESGFDDTFLVPSAGISYQELGDQNHFLAPILLGAGAFDAGVLTGLSFISNGPGANASIGDDGFGIFLPRGADSPFGPTDWFVLGYDDHINNQDDNHDDLMILAVIGAPVPEPGTWAMLLVGFGALGAAMRRKTSRALRLRTAIA